MRAVPSSKNSPLLEHNLLVVAPVPVLEFPGKANFSSPLRRSQWITSGSPTIREEHSATRNNLRRHLDSITCSRITHSQSGCIAGNWGLSGNAFDNPEATTRTGNH